MAKKTWFKLNSVWTEAKAVWMKIDGIWRKITPTIKINGSWRQAIQYRDYIYNLGIEKISFVQYAAVNTGSTFEKRLECLYLKGYNNYGYAIAGTESPIDISNYNTMYVEWEHISNNDSNYARIGLTSVKNNSKNYDVSFSQEGMGFSLRVDSVDVSSLTGEFYIKIIADAPINYAGTSSEIFVYKIWFE